MHVIETPLLADRMVTSCAMLHHAIAVCSHTLNPAIHNTHTPGTSLLPAAVGYAQAALGSGEPRLRRLGASQLGRLLLLQSADAAQRQEAAVALVTALQVRHKTQKCLCYHC